MRGRGGTINVRGHDRIVPEKQIALGSGAQRSDEHVYDVNARTSRAGSPDGGVHSRDGRRRARHPSGERSVSLRSRNERTTNEIASYTNANANVRTPRYVSGRSRITRSPGGSVLHRTRGFVRLVPAGDPPRARLSPRGTS